MKISEYEQMATRERDYWWHVGRLSIIDKQLQNIAKNKKLKILNIGCGTGGTIPTISKYGDVTNIDVSKEALRFLRKSGNQGVQFDGVKIPFKDSSYDLIVAFDVLEHIQYDQASLLEWVRVLKPKGKIFITVPAYQWLWSGHDESLHHWRRYTRNRLKWDLSKLGMSPTKLSYAISFSLPLVAGFRVLNKLAKRKLDEDSSYVNVPRFINEIFVLILRLEANWLSTFNSPFGTTVLGVFKKS